MKVLLLNLPSRSRVIRRYTCSYNASFFLFPPLELLQLGGVAKQVPGVEVHCLDAIAHALDVAGCRRDIQQLQPDLVVTLTGFETFGEDLDCIAALTRGSSSSAKFAVCGYYPTLFPETVLRHSPIDFIIRGEPEQTFAELLQALAGRGDYGAVPGLSWRDGERAVSNPDRQPVADPDQLPFAAYDLVDLRPYREPFLPQPFAALLASRGCPYRCSFCVRTYGDSYRQRSVANVLQEIRQLHAGRHVRTVRFMDDCLTADREWLRGLCQGLIAENLPLCWSCLGRADNLDPELLALMRRAGCRRLHLGIESGSATVLSRAHKGYQTTQLVEKLRSVRQAGIEAAGFFMVGFPFESDADIQASINLARAGGLDFITVCKFIPYPGTPIFDEIEASVAFSLFPYHHRFTDRSFSRIAHLREMRLLRQFYLCPKQLLRTCKLWLRHPLETIRLTWKFISYLAANRGQQPTDFI